MAELWRIQTSAGELTAEMLVVGAGPLSDPKPPDIAGIESFEGTMFHSARWDHEHALDGERVAVIGTGASSIQLVPQIQPQVGRLHVFQRTPPWVVPHRDRPTSRWERLLYRALPPAQRLVRGAVYWARELFVLPLMHPRDGSPPERVARRHLRAQVSDPALRARLEPTYRIGCKRILISNDYYPALQQPNVERRDRLDPRHHPAGILTADGAERELDTIILGTGFHVTDMPVAEWIHGSDGRTLAEVWQGSPQAYLGTAVAGFPNLFMLAGPNTGLGHNSIVFMIESQVHYLIECTALHGPSAPRHHRGARAGPAPTSTRRSRRRLQGTVWNTGGCVSWYLDEHGKNTTIWPGSTWPYRRRLRRFQPGDYALRPRNTPAVGRSRL